MYLNTNLIYSLVGKPIHVQKKEKPTIEEIEHIQKLYIEELFRYVRNSTIFGCW